MPKPKVGHLKNRKSFDHAITCDRTSVLGNPFELDKSKASSRSDVIEGFRRYLYLVTMKNKDPTEAAITVSKSLNISISKTWIKPNKNEVLVLTDRIVEQSQTKSITLLCWCSPLPCHCEVIANFVDYKSNQIRKKIMNGIQPTLASE
jgi:hypothetical protein